MANIETRLSARPLYLQVRDVLVQQISVGHWKPGGTLPNETQLAQQFGISIGTVRKALDMMELEHIVTRRQGRGTFVNDFTSMDAPVFSAFHDATGMRIASAKLSKRIQRLPAGDEEAARLGVRRGEEVVKVERLQEYEGITFMAETCFLPAKYFKTWPDDPATYRIAALLQQNGFVFGRAEEQVAAVTAGEEDSSDLGVEVGVPLLHLDRVTYSDHDHVVEWRVGRCALKNVRYLVRLN